MSRMASWYIFIARATPFSPGCFDNHAADNKFTDARVVDRDKFILVKLRFNAPNVASAQFPPAFIRNVLELVVGSLATRFQSLLCRYFLGI